MKGWWREEMGWLRLRVVLAFGLVLVGGGCGRGEEAGEADGEGMEPRIVTEGPVDAPGRPERGEVAAVDLDAGEGEARWVPHLTVSDLAASVEFYRGLGFAAADGEEAAGGTELERDGVRLVLVAAEPEGAPAGEEDAADEDPAGGTPAGAPAVLHLVGEAGGAPREVRDPDGHLLVISDP